MSQPTIPPGQGPVVVEWLDKAADDFRTAERELAVGTDPHYGAVCFHAQQAVEKAMKAVLIARGSTPPKIHDLRELDRLIRAVEPSRSWSLEELRRLGVGAVEYRYSGRNATRHDAEGAMDSCRRMWPALCALL